MKVLVDAMCAEFGGIRTYVEHLLAIWPDLHPEDELHVLVPTGSSLPTPGLVRHEVEVPSPAEVGRPFVQTRALRRLTQELRPDAALLTLPSTTVLRLGVPSVVTVYDLRHVLRPEQFSRKQRLLRKVSYGRGYAVADEVVAISQRSLDDLHRVHPRTRRTPSRVTYLGADHVLAWPEAGERTHAFAFGHHSNKNLDLVLDSWRTLVDDGVDVPGLLILGVGKARRDEVGAMVAQRGLDAHVTLAPFLDDDEFQRTMASSSVIVFPTDFEGFGLPVPEAMTLGIPVVIGPEAATVEVAGGHAHVASAFTAPAVAEAVRAALAATPEQLEAARVRGGEFTWARTVESTRSALEDARRRVGGAPAAR